MEHAPPFHTHKSSPRVRAVGREAYCTALSCLPSGAGDVDVNDTEVAHKVDRCPLPLVELYRRCGSLLVAGDMHTFGHVLQFKESPVLFAVWFTDSPNAESLLPGDGGGDVLFIPFLIAPTKVR